MRTRAIEFSGILSKVSDADMATQRRKTYPESKAAVGAIGKRLEGLLLGGRAVERAEACGVGPLDDNRSVKA